MYDRICLVHYHEIGLKGRNRSSFERRLLDNLRAALVSYPCTVKKISGHLVATVEDPAVLEDIASVMARTPGVVKVSLGYRTDRVLEQMLDAAKISLLENESFETFKVAARRSNTDFELDSMELNQVVGAHLCEAAPDKKVKMKHPDVTVHVQVVQGSCYIFSRSIPGVGGLPVGSAGRVVSLLSAGIDSPVATWQMCRRGAVAIAVHFSGRPQTSDSSEYLVKDIIETLEPSLGVARLYVVALGDHQREISLTCPPKLRVIMYRRLMFKVAEQIAHTEGAEALVTGESLGQVASQTLSNIAATDDVVSMPVLRPLIGADKQEIIKRAEELGTFEISIQNQNDCCTLFMPRNPETHAHLDEVRTSWDTLPIDEWVEDLVSHAEVYDYRCPAYKAKKKRTKSPRASE